jgi:hypothetical protein
MFPHGISSRRVRLTLSSVLLGVCLLGLLASSAVALPPGPRSILQLGDPDHTPWNAGGSRVMRSGDPVYTPWDAARLWAAASAAGTSDKVADAAARRSDNWLMSERPFSAFLQTTGAHVVFCPSFVQAWLRYFVMVQ